MSFGALIHRLNSPVSFGDFASVVERDCAELGFGFLRDAYFDSVCSSRSFVWVYFDHVDQQMALVYLDGPRKVLLLFISLINRVDLIVKTKCSISIILGYCFDLYVGKITEFQGISIHP